MELDSEKSPQKDKDHRSELQFDHLDWNKTNMSNLILIYCINFCMEFPNAKALKTSKLHIEIGTKGWHSAFCKHFVITETIYILLLKL